MKFSLSHSFFVHKLTMFLKFYAKTPLQKYAAEFYLYSKTTGWASGSKEPSGDEAEIKTPFAIMRVRSANCTRNSKRRTFRMGLNDVNSLSHTKWNCKYHIVFAPKYRRKVFYGEKRREIGEILRTLCNWKKIKIIEAEVCPDHVHMLLEIPPKVSVSSFMGYLKGKSSLMIYEKYPELRYKYRNREFWCRGYYVDTAGKNAKKIQEYIQHQLEEDKAGEQLTMGSF